MACCRDSVYFRGEGRLLQLVRASGEKRELFELCDWRKKLFVYIMLQSHDSAVLLLDCALVTV